MFRLTILGILFVLILVGCSDDSENSEAAIPELSLISSSDNLMIGQAIKISLNISDLTESIFALSLQINLNSENLELVQSLGNETGNVFSDNALVFISEADNVIHISITQLQGDEEVMSDGELLSFQLNTDSAGNYNLSIEPESVNFFDSSGNEVLFENLLIENLDLVIN